MQKLADRLPDSAPVFSEDDGAEILSLESHDGMRSLHCRLKPEGYGVLDWNM